MITGNGFGGGFGYVMKLRPPNYKNIIDMMKRVAEPDFATLCLIGFNLADCYQKLHSAGYCYRDISFGNLFFEENTGNVLICDNDNVSPNNKKNTGVSGTQRFMAPEIVRCEANPSTDTDLYSMAVLLFYMFMLHHPLEGKHEADIKCFDVRAMNRIYGFAPVFIWDADDKTNRPVPGYQDNAIIYWGLYPRKIKDLFYQAFTDGLKNPKKRVLEKQWKDALLALRDSIVYCPFCDSENFYDTERGGCACWSCKKNILLPPVLKIGNGEIMLNKNTKISEHHITGNYGIASYVGAVSQKPGDPSVWGIRNDSGGAWRYKNADGTVINIEHGKSAPITSGASIDFGAATGLITGMGLRV